MKKMVLIATFLASTVVLGQDKVVIELTKQEALDLVVARDQVEEAMLILDQRRERFNRLLAGIYAAHGVSTETHGWIPTTGQFVPLKTNEDTEEATSEPADSTTDQ